MSAGHVDRQLRITACMGMKVISLSILLTSETEEQRAAVISQGQFPANNKTMET